MVALLVLLAMAFGFTNGLHDAGNAIAAPIVTRALRPSHALAWSFVFHLAGAMLAGTAVAATIGGVVSLTEPHLVAVICAAIAGALLWSLVTLRLGLPCSSGHCLVGALAGAALANSGTSVVHFGGMHGLRPVGVLGVLIWLSLSAAVAVPLALLADRAGLRLSRRARREVVRPIRRAEVVTTAVLSFAHGSNDAQKTMGLIAISLVATGHLTTFSVPVWVAAVAAVCLASGTALGGWRVVATIGRRIFRLSPLDGLASQAASAAIVLTASLLGAPVSTTDVVAPSIVGVGAGRSVRHVRWRVVGEIALSWLVTLPVSGLLGAAGIELWRWWR